MASDAFALDTLEFAVVRERLAGHTSFSAGRALALRLEPTSEPMLVKSSGRT